MEHIKCIITMDHVLVLNADEENVITFIEELQRRLTPPDSGDGTLKQVDSSGDLNGTPEKPKEPGSKVLLSAIEETPFELRTLEVALDMVRHTHSS